MAERKVKQKLSKKDLKDQKEVEIQNVYVGEQMSK